MRKFEKTYRLQADSVEDVAAEFERVCLELTRHVRFQGRKLRAGPILNALALWFVELPGEERTRFAGQIVAKLEARLGEAPASAAAPPVRQTVPGKSIERASAKKGKAG